MQEKKKFVITINEVLVFVGVIGCLTAIISMVIHWVLFGTPFVSEIGLFQNPIADSLLLLVMPIGILIWGLYELRKKRAKNKQK